MEVVRGDDINVKTGIDIPSMILDKISTGVDKSIETPGLRPFRELLQNSDDARASSMTIRFDKDRMYLHNDGWTIEEEFVYNISKIFKKSKEQDPDTSGNFGTGFRSTYMYTDAPELEWLVVEDDKKKHRTYKLPLGVEGELDWTRIEEDVEGAYQTFDRESEEPDDEGHTRLGVLFRFPWRLKNQWANESGWDKYTWDAEKIRKLGEDFRNYAPTALLACRHLKTIRIIMAGAAKNDDEMWDFVATRDRTILQIRDENPSKYTSIVDEINLSFGVIGRGKEFFDCQSGKWSRTKGSGHAWYDFNSLEEQLLETDNYQKWSYSVYGEVNGGTAAGVDKELANKLGFWNTALLLMPRFPDAPKLPIYTPIPLAGRTRNRFGIVAMLPPEESRLHVDVGGGIDDEDHKKDWLLANIKAVSDTYSCSLRTHIHNLTSTGEEKERTIIACLPRDAPNTWFGTGGKLGAISKVDESTPQYNDWWDPLKDEIQEITDDEYQIAWVNEEMVALSETCYPWEEGKPTKEMTELLELLRAPSLSPNWYDFWADIKQNSSPTFFAQILDRYLFTSSSGRCSGSKSVSGSPQVLATVISENWTNAVESGDLDRVSEILLEGICEKNLVDDWDVEAKDLLNVKCVITQEDTLIPIQDVINTTMQPKLVELLPDSRLLKDKIREDYIERISKADANFREAIYPTASRVLKTIDDDAKARPDVHSDLEAHDSVWEAISELLRFAMDTSGDARNRLNEEELRKLFFVPCRWSGKVSTMQNNIIDDYLPQNNLTWGYGKLEFTTSSQQYHRDFIFKDSDQKKKDEARSDLEELEATLPLKVFQRLRFLALHPKVTPDKVSKALELNFTGSKGKRTNLIRTLLFQHGGGGLGDHQNSLYRDDKLQDWISKDPTPELVGVNDTDFDVDDPDDLKLNLLISLLSPFEEGIPQGQGVSAAPDIPMVLGDDGLWREGRNYCLTLDPSISDKFEDLAAVDVRLIDGLSIGVLKQLGVKDTLGPALAMGPLLEMIDDEDSESITLVMMSLLSSEKKWSSLEGEDRDAWEDLQALEWVPSLNGHLNKPDEILFPSEENVELMGVAYHNFPLKSTWDRLREHQTNCHDLGMIKTPTDGMLMLAFCGFHTEGNAPSKAMSELMKKIKNRKEPTKFEDLEWGPHDGISEGDFVVRLKRGGSLTNDPEIWAAPDNNTAGSLADLFPSHQVVYDDQLADIERRHLEHIRQLGLLAAGPDRETILEALSQEELEPQEVNGLWALLAKIPPPTYNIPTERTERREFKRKYPVLYCPDDKVMKLSDGIVLTKSADEHLDEHYGLILYHLDEDDPVAMMKRMWFEAFGVKQKDDLNVDEILEDMVGLELLVGSQGEKLRKIKSLLPKAENGLYLPVWMNTETVKIKKIQAPGSKAINPVVPHSVPDAFRVFPIVHIVQGDPPDYVSWIRTVSDEGVLFYADASSLEPEPEDIDYVHNSSLTLAFKQILEALHLIQPTVFDDYGKETICRMGRGGVPVFRKIEWRGEEEKSLVDRQQMFQYVNEKGELVLFVDEDDEIGNPDTSSKLFVKGLEESGWFEQLGRRLEDTGGRFGHNIADKVRDLLDTPPEEWKHLDWNGASLLDKEWKSHGRLFESSSAAEMRRKLTAEYGGCQICGMITPRSEYGDETQESLVSIAKSRGSPYYVGTIDASLPLGNQIWICPRHRVLYERKLVRFTELEDAFGGRHEWGRNPIPANAFSQGISKLEEMRDAWEEGMSLKVKIFDQEISWGITDDIGVEPSWNVKDLNVTSEHAKAILTKLIDLLKSTNSD